MNPVILHPINSNSMPMAAPSLTAFHGFLAAARISIRFQDPVPASAWNEATCSRVMIIALRSPSDVLSANYTSFPAFTDHVGNVCVNDEPVAMSDECVAAACDPRPCPSLPSLIPLQLQPGPHRCLDAPVRPHEHALHRHGAASEQPLCRTAQLLQGAGGQER